MLGTISHKPVKFGTISVSLKREKNSSDGISLVLDDKQYFNITEYPTGLKHKVNRFIFRYNRELLDKIQDISSPERWKSILGGSTRNEIEASSAKDPKFRQRIEAKVKSQLADDPEFKSLIKNILNLLDSVQQPLGRGNSLSTTDAQDFGGLFEKYRNSADAEGMQKKMSDAERLQLILRVNDLPRKIKEGQFALKFNKENSPILQIVLSGNKFQQAERHHASRGGAKKRFNWEPEHGRNFRRNGLKFVASEEE
jgi:hypothetical protein